MGKRTRLFALTIFIFIAILAIYHFSKTKDEAILDPQIIKPPVVSGPPEISGWVAWWKEETGFELVSRHSGLLKEISPFCYVIQDDLSILDRCKMLSSPDTIKTLKSLGLTVIPTLGSDLRYDKLTPLLADPEKSSQLSQNIVSRLLASGADGLDVDIEGVSEEDRDKFSSFLKILSENLKQNNLNLSVTLHAQDGRKDYKITRGQDLSVIGSVADEVRIMAYDQHGTFSEAGAITPNSWLTNVVKYNLTKIPREKLVIGLPAYGYIWETSGASKGYQFDEFNQSVLDRNISYTTQRDPGSSELVYLSDNYEGWLSDSEAIVSKIDLVRSLGINRFVLWNLGGIDEKLFDHRW